MMNLNDILGPMNEEDQIAYAVEALTVSVQLAIQKVMHEKCVSQRQLAERLGVSAARVSQMLSAHNPNLTLKVLGRIAHALGDEFELFSVSEVRAMRDRKPDTAQEHKGGDAKKPKVRSGSWVDNTANDNRYPYLAVAA